MLYVTQLSHLVGETLALHGASQLWCLLHRCLWPKSSHLSLGTEAVGREGILPLWEPKMGDQKSVIGREGFGEKMPVKGSVQKPDLGVRGDN